MTEDAGRPALLRDLVRQGERLLDRQVETLAAQEAKNERAVALGFAILAAAPTAYAFLATSRPHALAGFPMAFLGASGVLALVGIAWLAFTGLSRPVETVLGPEAEWLRAASRKRGVTGETADALLLDALPDFAQANRAQMVAGVRHRRVGLALLLAALTAFAVAFLLVLFRGT